MTLESRAGCLIIVPKNKGLQAYTRQALSSIEGVDPQMVVEVRGEDVPLWVRQLSSQGKKAIGMTGEDLFREYCLETRDSRMNVLKRFVWNDERAMYGKPALCLLGPGDKTLDSLPKSMKVCVASKYKRIARTYLNLLEGRGFAFKKVYVNGSSEMVYSQGLATLLVDIVYTGDSMRRAGLSVYDKIMESDFVMIGDSDDNA